MCVCACVWGACVHVCVVCMRACVRACMFIRDMGKNHKHDIKTEDFRIKATPLV